MQGHFEKVIQFNFLFGKLKENKISNDEQLDPKTMNSCFSLIEEEFNELKHAINTQNLIETIDAVIDLEYVILGMAAILGININPELEKCDNIFSLLINAPFQLIENSVFELKQLLHKISNVKENIHGFMLASDLLVLNNAKLMIKTKLVNLMFNLKMMGCLMNNNNINMNLAFDLVHDNNLSKLCKTESEALATKEDFFKKGELNVDYRLAVDNKHFVVYNKNTNKILKSINYKSVDLSDVFITK